MTRQGIMCLSNKVEAIKNIPVPTTKKKLRSFIGLINYNRYMWQHRFNISTTLPNMTSEQAK